MADKEREIGFKVTIDGVSDAEMNMSRLTVQIKNTQRELSALEKAMQKGIASNEQLARHAQLTKHLDENRKALAEVKKGLDIGGFGTYWTKLGTTIMDNLKGLVSTGAVLGIVAAGFNKMKEAIMSTVGGLDYMNQVAEVSRQLFYDLVTTGQLSFDKLQKAAEAAEIMNKIRAGDRQDLIEVAKLERAVNDARFEASNQMASNAEKLEALNKAYVAHNKLYDYQIQDKKEDLEATMKLLELRPRDEKLLLRQAELVAKIISLDSQRSSEFRRVESQRTGLMKDEEKKWEYWHTKLQEAADYEIEQQKERVKAREEATIKISSLLQEEKDKINELLAKIAEEMTAEMDLYNKKKDLKVGELRLNKEIQESNKRTVELSKEDAKAEADNYRAMQDAKVMAATMGLESIGVILGRQTAAGKAFAIAAATVDTYAAAGKALNDPTVPSTILRFALMAATIIRGLANVSQIVRINTENKTGFETGGKINRGIPVNTGTKDNLLIAVNNTETVLTDRQVAMLGGSRTMRNIGVPGYATGGYVGAESPNIQPTSTIGREDFTDMANRLSQIEVVLNVNKLNSAQNELSIINQTQRL